MKKQSTKIDIKNIKDPDFLKDLSYEELDSLSSQIREYLLYCTSKNGGHIASNLGVVETTISLCKNFNFKKDKIIFDVGHQSYVYKILTGRSLETLRQKNGISGFQKINESPYDHFEAGHSSTSISVANGIAIARDLNNENYNVIAFIGDSSISNGLAFEGLNNIAASKHKVIIVLNDNEMSISSAVGGLSHIFREFATSEFYVGSKDFIYKTHQKTKLGRWLLKRYTKIKNWFKRKLINVTIFDTLGYALIGPIDGHNIKHLDKAFAKAKSMNKSVVVYVKTIKGKGYPFAEQDKCGEWHGVGKFDIETGKMLSNNESISWSEQYKLALKEEMAINEKLITVVPATEHGSALDQIFELYPNRAIDVGIAEEHAFTMSGGLSVSGYHPVICIYSTFMQRSYDELSHDLARLNLNATILIDRSGLVGNDGETHQGIYDEAFLYTIPNVIITMASRANESYSLFKESTKNHGVFAIRFPRECVVNTFNEESELPFASWIKETDGKNTAVVSVGPVTLKLKELILKNKINATLFNAIYLRPMDEEKVNELLNYSKVIIYNAYATKEGFAQALEAKLISLNYKGTIIIKTVPTEFIKQATIQEQREDFSLTPEDILKII